MSVEMSAEMSVSVEIVVARYNEDITWLIPFLDNYKIIIYNKGNPLTNIDERFIQVHLPNIGREAHTYLYHICENYNHLADVTVFLQGKVDDHLKEHFEGINENEFVKKMIEDANIYGTSTNCIEFSEKFDDFNLCEYKGDCLTPVGMNLGLFFEKYLGITQHENKCYVGALFATKNNSIKKLPYNFYKTFQLFCKSKNEELAHFLERSWYIIFSNSYLIKLNLIDYYMNYIEHEELLYEYELQNFGRPKLVTDNSEKFTDVSFHKVGYQMILDSDEYGYQDIKVTFYSLSNNCKDFKIPTVEDPVNVLDKIAQLKTTYTTKTKVKKITKADIFGCTSESLEDEANAEILEHEANAETSLTDNDYEIVEKTIEKSYPYGKFRLTPYNYNPCSLVERTTEGSYGGLQIIDNKDNVLLAFNNHNHIADLGIGSKPLETSNFYVDWTFSHNAEIYTTKKIFVFGLRYQNTTSYKYLRKFVDKEKIILPKYTFVLDDTQFIQQDDKTWIISK